MKRGTTLLFVALILGLGWAMRGHFGHEHGAAWAGAMAGMAVLVASKRKDWIARLPTLAALAGIGWGVGGMMSYGIIVGYGRGIDFGNVYYGLAMLGVVGGLYGFIGGGMFGLGLETTESKRPKWANLLTEMIAGGLLVWGILIYQLEWFMTPPRSELWAACFGAAVALAWFCYRYQHFKALRIAGYASLGAGFGFAFGNFLQVMGNTTALALNWWNVMEFSLGFFGGLGMAYGVFTREWPEGRAPSKSANMLAFLFLFLALPITNIVQAFDAEKFLRVAEQLGIQDGNAFARLQTTFAYVTTLVFLLIGAGIYRSYLRRSERGTSLYAPAMLFSYTLFYLAFCHIIKLFFYGGPGFSIEIVLYWVVVLITAVIWFFHRKIEPDVSFKPALRESWPRWLILVGGFLVILALITWIAINSHGVIPGAHERF